MTSNPRLVQIAGWMALADHDFVQISKSTGLSYQEAEKIWRSVQEAKDEDHGNIQQHTTDAGNIGGRADD
jgi:hypothetical protein